MNFDQKIKLFFDEKIHLFSRNIHRTATTFFEEYLVLYYSEAKCRQNLDRPNSNRDNDLKLKSDFICWPSGGIFTSESQGSRITVHNNWCELILIVN